MKKKYFTGRNIRQAISYEDYNRKRHEDGIRNKEKDFWQSHDRIEELQNNKGKLSEEKRQLEKSLESLLKEKTLTPNGLPSWTLHQKPFREYLDKLNLSSEDKRECLDLYERHREVRRNLGPVTRTISRETSNLSEKSKHLNKKRKSEPYQYFTDRREYYTDSNKPEGELYPKYPGDPTPEKGYLPGFMTKDSSNNQFKTTERESSMKKKYFAGTYTKRFFAKKETEFSISLPDTEDLDEIQQNIDKTTENAKKQIEEQKRDFIKELQEQAKAVQEASEAASTYVQNIKTLKNGKQEEAEKLKDTKN